MRSLLLLLPAIILLAACGVAAHTPSPEAPPAPTATPPRTPLPPPITPAFPTGAFHHKHETTYCIYQFNEDGTWAFFWKLPSLDLRGRQPYLQGTYTTEANLYTETSISPFECAPATYTWTFDGRTLAFQVVGEDNCGDRQQTLESPLLWARVE